MTVENKVVSVIHFLCSGSPHGIIECDIKPIAHITTYEDGRTDVICPMAKINEVFNPANSIQKAKEYKCTFAICAYKRPNPDSSSQ